MRLFNIILDAVLYCIQWTFIIFWTGLKWLLYDIPVFLKERYGDGQFGKRDSYELEVDNFEDVAMPESVKVEKHAKTDKKAINRTDDQEKDLEQHVFDGMNLINDLRGLQQGGSGHSSSGKTIDPAKKMMQMLDNMENDKSEDKKAA